MLRQLYIRNFALIDTLNIDLHEGFSVITGETGAGKSIILGAIGLLLGQRADLKAIKQDADKCIIEAHFDLSRYDLKPLFEQYDIEYDQNDTIIRRELTASGKSRAFINDSPVSLAVLKELGERLIDVHSQHQNLLLGKQDFQLSVIDIIADDLPQREDYQDAFSAYQHQLQQLELLKESISQNRQQTDFMKFQLDELQNAHLVAGEQEELEQQRDTLEHAEDIKTALYEADNGLNGEQGNAVAETRRAQVALTGIADVYPQARELSERLESCQIELKDIAREVSSLLDNIDFNASELDSINQRLDRIYELEKKYHAENVEDLLAVQEKLQKTLNDIENSDEALAALQKEIAVLQDKCQQKANVLTKAREKAAKEIEKQMRQRLVPLGMPHVQFEARISQDSLGRNGQDKASFYFSANTSTPLLPVAQVASGGEIARVMLSLKAMISGAVKLPTIIFDEIDTGVSGKIAEKMAEIMQEMGANERQVISITHLPQIAARGSHHYRVSKEDTPHGTTSHMGQLTAQERVGEIAQMLSGSDVSEAAIQNAKDLLKIKDH